MFSPMIISKENLFIKSIFVFFYLSRSPRTVVTIVHCALCNGIVPQFLFFINNAKDSSCTSRPQQWGKPSGKPTYDPNKDLKDLFTGNFCPKICYLSVHADKWHYFPCEAEE